MTRNNTSTNRRGLIPAVVTALVVMLPVQAPGQQPAPVYCDDCAQVARDAFEACQRGGSPVLLCISVARQVRENCDLVCVSRPAQVTCSAGNVQHWNKIVFRIPQDRRIEADNSLAGTTNSLAEVIVRSEPNEFLDPFFSVKRTLELRPFCVSVLNANREEVERRCDNLLRSDIEITDIDYSTVCAEERPSVQVNPPR